jgi:PPOX class probable F420-dependent enzyme
MASWTSAARRLLERGRVGHLATADATGRPHVVPVCYAFDESALYFVADEKPKRTAARSLKRLRNLRENPHAALVVDEWDEDWTRLAWVMVRGPAAVESDATRRADALARLRRRYPQYDAMRLDDANAHPLVRLSAAHVMTWCAT